MPQSRKQQPDPASQELAAGSHVRLAASAMERAEGELTKLRLLRLQDRDHKTLNVARHEVVVALREVTDEAQRALEVLGQ